MQYTINVNSTSTSTVNLIRQSTRALSFFVAYEYITSTLLMGSFFYYSVSALGLTKTVNKNIIDGSATVVSQGIRNLVRTINFLVASFFTRSSSISHSFAIGLNSVANRLSNISKFVSVGIVSIAQNLVRNIIKVISSAIYYGQIVTSSLMQSFYGLFPTQFYDNSGIVALKTVQKITPTFTFENVNRSVSIIKTNNLIIQTMTNIIRLIYKYLITNTVNIASIKNNLYRYLFVQSVTMATFVNYVGKSITANLVTSVYLNRYISKMMTAVTAMMFIVTRMTSKWTNLFVVDGVSRVSAVNKFLNVTITNVITVIRTTMKNIVSNIPTMTLLTRIVGKSTFNTVVPSMMIIRQLNSLVTAFVIGTSSAMKLISRSMSFSSLVIENVNRSYVITLLTYANLSTLVYRFVGKSVNTTVIEYTNKFTSIVKSFMTLTGSSLTPKRNVSVSRSNSVSIVATGLRSVFKGISVSMFETVMRSGSMVKNVSTFTQSFVSRSVNVFSKRSVDALATASLLYGQMFYRTLSVGISSATNFSKNMSHAISSGMTSSSMSLGRNVSRAVLLMTISTLSRMITIRKKLNVLVSESNTVSKNILNSGISAAIYYGQVITSPLLSTFFANASTRSYDNSGMSVTKSTKISKNTNITSSAMIPRFVFRTVKAIMSYTSSLRISVVKTVLEAQTISANFVKAVIVFSLTGLIQSMSSSLYKTVASTTNVLSRASIGYHRFVYKNVIAVTKFIQSLNRSIVTTISVSEFSWNSPVMNVARSVTMLVQTKTNVFKFMTKLLKNMTFSQVSSLKKMNIVAEAMTFVATITNVATSFIADLGRNLVHYMKIFIDVSYVENSVDNSNAEDDVSSPSVTIKVE